jgi:hypothetical protein
MEGIDRYDFHSQASIPRDRIHSYDMKLGLNDRATAYRIVNYSHFAAAAAFR